MSVNPIPKGYHAVTPYLSVGDAPRLIAFLETAFAAQELQRHAMPDGRVINAQVRVGDSMLLVADAPPGRPPKPAVFYMHVADVDSAYAKAVQAGGRSIREPSDEFYGDRIAGVEDLSGNQWFLASHVEEMSEDELVKRALRDRS